MSLYHGIYRQLYELTGDGTEPVVNFTLPAVIFTSVGLGFSLGVLLSVGLLLGFQMRVILRNQTRIEDWILDKATKRRKDTGLNLLQ